MKTRVVNEVNSFNNDLTPRFNKDRIKVKSHDTDGNVVVLAVGNKEYIVDAYELAEAVRRAAWRNK